MKPTPLRWTILAVAAAAPLGFGQDLRVVSTFDPAQGAPSGGSGDSYAPITSGDGRYVLFASLANNLSLMTNSTPIPVRIPPALNVFLRDRTYGTTTLVSVNTSGVAGGNGDSVPAAISTNGQYALFESSANDLVPGDTNKTSDLFVRDLVNGTTTLISASTNGYFGNGPSRDAVMTPDGRYVAFVSGANNLVVGDTNRIADVFIRDVKTGTTALVSVGARSTSSNPASGTSEAPEITPDGRYVAFFSNATNLVAGVPVGGDVYVRDLANNTTTWASTGARAAVLAWLGSTTDVAYNHAISADGQYVAYEASRGSNPGPNYSGLILRYNLANGLTDLVHTNASLGCGANEDISSLDLSSDGRFVAFVANTNGTAGTTTCVSVWDAQSGSISFVSTGRDGTVPAGSVCDFPTFSGNGQFVAFLSTATNLVTNATNGAVHVYVRDLQAGVTTLVDGDANGLVAARGPNSRPGLSADGRWIAFDEADGTLVAGDRNRDSDVFVRDLIGGTEIISAHDPALVSASANGMSVLMATALSGDGRYLTFASDADNLLPDHTNAWRDIFVRDLVLGSNVLVSVGTNGASADGQSSEPSISGDGRYVAFTSGADNLVNADSNKMPDVFVRDLLAGITIRASVRTDGVQANSASYSPVISSNGRYVLFRSKATNLGASPGENLFLRNVETGATYAITTNGVTTAAMTPDARLIAFTDTSGAGAGKYYVWDTQAAARTATNVTLLGLLTLGISPDGNRVAQWAGSGVLSLLVYDRSTAQVWTITNGPSPTARASLRFSRNGQALAYNKNQAGTNQVYVFDFLADTNMLVSGSYDGAGAASADCDSVDLSADGRFIVYRSAATNVVAGCTNGLPNVFLYDRQTGSNAVMSAGLPANGGGNNRSLTPVFSSDGHTLCFASWASDLASEDFNGASDLFAYSFFYAMILPGGDPTQGPWLSWPVSSGKTYRVQYQDTLGDPAWHDLTGTITNEGTKAWLQDANPPNSHRFYRVSRF